MRVFGRRLAIVTAVWCVWLFAGWAFLGSSSLALAICVYGGFLVGGVVSLVGHFSNAGLWSSAVGGMVRMLVVAFGLLIVHQSFPIPINSALFSVGCFLCLLLVDTVVLVQQSAVIVRRTTPESDPNQLACREDNLF